jgi:hypothetical protein
LGISFTVLRVLANSSSSDIQKCSYQRWIKSLHNREYGHEEVLYDLSHKDENDVQVVSEGLLIDLKVGEESLERDLDAGRGEQLAGDEPEQEEDGEEAVDPPEHPQEPEQDLPQLAAAGRFGRLLSGRLVLVLGRVLEGRVDYAVQQVVYLQLLGLQRGPAYRASAHLRT